MNDEDYVIRGTISPEEYEVVLTDLERIQEAFEEKRRDPKFCTNDGVRKWEKYLNKLGLEMIGSDTTLADPLQYLLERLYSGNLDGVVVRDPSTVSGVSTPGFIFMSREFAQKVLVLGGLP